jgi:ribose transport system permease protein
MTMVRGLVQLLTGARTLAGLPQCFLAFGQADYIYVLSQFWIWVLLAIIPTFVLTNARFGRNVYAIGALIVLAVWIDRIRKGRASS